MLTDVERRERLTYAIAEAMRRQHLTPPRLGKLIGRHSDTVRRWRDGETVPSVLDILPLAQGLGVDPSYLIDPPPVPEYPIAEYLVRQAAEDAVEQGMELGRRPLEREAG